MIPLISRNLKISKVPLIMILLGNQAFFIIATRSAPYRNTSIYSCQILELSAIIMFIFYLRFYFSVYKARKCRYFCHFKFPWRKFFGRKKFNSVVEVFLFRFPETAHNAWTLCRQNRWWLVQNICNPRRFSNPLLPGSNPFNRQFFTFSDNPVTILFLNGNFFRNYCFPDVTARHCSFTVTLKEPNVFFCKTVYKTIMIC